MPHSFKITFSFPSALVNLITSSFNGKKKHQKFDKFLGTFEFVVKIVRLKNIPSGGPQPEWRRSTEGIKVKQIAHSTATPRFDRPNRSFRNHPRPKKVDEIRSIARFSEGKTLQHFSKVKNRTEKPIHPERPWVTANSPLSFFCFVFSGVLRQGILWSKTKHRLFMQQGRWMSRKDQIVVFFSYKLVVTIHQWLCLVPVKGGR